MSTTKEIINVDPGYADPCPLCGQPVTLICIVSENDAIHSWQSLTPTRYFIFRRYELEHPSGVRCIFTEDVFSIQIRRGKVLFWLNGHRVHRRRNPW